VSQPLTDQRRRAELIAELYDRHAAGLFAYCADQLGDLGAASDVLAAVLNGVPDTAPPRAALYAFARREIHRRDIVYSPPAVDPFIDPATALVERSLRELRPHQREVLVLCAVCGLSKDELAWVLDVAPDTAEELTIAAGQQFRQALSTALASAGGRLPTPVADVYGALRVAPLPDVLGRLPWPQPPGALRIHFAGSRPAAPGPLFTKPRWPSPPVWPQPLAEADPATSTVIFPAELLTPPASSRRPEHDATTAPMPKLRDPLRPPGDILDPDLPLRDPLGSTRAFRDPRTGLPFGEQGSARDPRDVGDVLAWSDKAAGKTTDRAPDRAPDRAAGKTTGRGTDRAADRAADRASKPVERPFYLAEPPPSATDPFMTGDVILPKDAPDPYMTGDVLVHNGPARPVPRPKRSDRQRPPMEPRPTPEEFLRLPETPLGAVRTPETVREPAAPLFRPHTRPAEQPGKSARRGSGRKAAGREGRGKPAKEPVYRLPERLSAPEPGPQAGSEGSLTRAEGSLTGTETSLTRAEGSQATSGAEQRVVRETPREAGTRAVRELVFEAGWQETSPIAPRPVRARPVPKRRPEVTRRPPKQRRRKDRHYDWVWEAAGFLLCVAIAMIVFFSMPSVLGP
jgi:DNA-directed RNA polymerase specialized sigma24 family protein